MGRHIEAGTLFGVAKRAAQSIEAERREGGQIAALTSIVFSVLAVEAFLNEVTELAAWSRYKDSEPESVIAFARFMSDSELARLPLLSRLIHGNWILTGKNVDKGSAPFQDFSLLLGLRNDLVHFKPNEDIEVEIIRVKPEEVHKKRLEKLRSKNVLATSIAGNPLSGVSNWTFYVSTKAVADWGCAVASEVVLDFCGKVPPSMWGETVRILGDNSFKIKNAPPKQT